MKRKHLSILLPLLLAVLVSLACGPFTQPAAPTAQVITVVVQPSAAPLPTQPAQPTAAPTLVPTQPAPSATLPPDLPRAAFNGISFSYPQSLAANVSYEIVPANPATADSPGWDIYPQYTLFNFNDYALAHTFHNASIAVYPTAEYAAMQPYAAEAFSRLAQVLASRQTSFTGNQTLPLLPIWNAAQMLQSNVSYFRFANGSGVRYLTQYGQAVYPINNEAVFYTYQGITDDGKYYITAVLPVNHEALPNTAEEGIPNGDWQGFSENFLAYLEAIEPWMDELPADGFTPRLEELDAMLASLTVNP